MISDINVSRPAEMRSASTRERRLRHDCGSFIHIKLTTVGGSTQGLEWAVLGPFFFYKEGPRHWSMPTWWRKLARAVVAFDWPGLEFQSDSGAWRNVVPATWFAGCLIGWRSGAGAVYFPVFPPPCGKFKIGKESFHINIKTSARSHYCGFCLGSPTPFPFLFLLF